MATRKPLVFDDNLKVQELQPGDNVGAAHIDRIVVVKDANQAHVKVDGSVWKVIARFEFTGTDKRTPTSIRAVAKSKDPGGTFDLRVRDVTNTATIAEVTATSSDDWDIHDLGTISNLTAAAAVWEFQGQKNSDEGELSSALIEY